MRPEGPGWAQFDTPEIAARQTSLWWSGADWVAGCGLIYCSLFGIGRLLLGPAWQGFALLALGVACAWFIYWDLDRRGWSTLSQ